MTRHAVRSRLQPLTDIAIFLAANTAVFFAARLALLYFVLPSVTDTAALAKALYIGLKFDARIAVFLTLPTAFCLLWPRAERAVSGCARGAARLMLLAITVLAASLCFLVYVFDFGFYFYLNQHIGMGAKVFLEDPSESLRMVWESYPVIAITAGYAAFCGAYAVLYAAFLRSHVPGSFPAGRKGRLERAAVSAAALFALLVAGYGQVSSNLFPLRWSNAYFSPDKNIALIAINPVQNLFDTRNQGKAVKPSREDALDSWPRMAEYLRIPAGNAPLDFVRRVPGRAGGGRLNVVVIIMESLCWERTSLAPSMPASLGPDIDPTPFLRELAAKSLYFPNFYAPTRTTARAVFTTVSGVPDVNHTGGTTSRNPSLVDQNTLISEFSGYEKYYMIGGNANWANIRGLIQYNTEGLNLLEESSWKASNTDVWGVADVPMFREAVDALGAGASPFVAVIQSASFHRPYTITEDNEGFVVPPVPSKEALDWYGYENPEEFRSMHLADHALRRFFAKASKQPWFGNTVFAVFGDHGLNHDSTNITPGVQACNLQAWHVPLLIYAPGGQVAPRVDPSPRMQPDVLETMAVLAGVGHLTNTMGRDLLDPDTARDAAAFISQEDNMRFLIRDGYVYAMRPQGDALYRLDERTADGKAHDLREEEPGRAGSMRRQALDFYRTSKWLLHNNGKDVLARARKNAEGR